MRIIVIGGGVMGLACGWRLALRGAKVMLFEGRQCGGGASGASLGALWPPGALNDNPLQRLHRESLWRFQGFIDELSLAAGLQVPFERHGRIELLKSEQAVTRAKEEIFVANQEWPVLVGDRPPQEFLSADLLRQLFPTSLATGYGGLLCHNSAQVHIPSLLAALVSACRSAGVVIQENDAVTAIVPRGVQTSKGLYEADALLVTAGAWTRTLLPAVAVVPVKGEGLAIERPASLKFCRLLKYGSVYLVPWENEILVGATTEPAAQFDETPTVAAREKLLAGAAEILPELRSSRILRHWTGLRPDAPHHQPLMGPMPTAPNVFICTAHYKTGIALAPLVSDLMARRILEGVPVPQLQPFLPSDQCGFSPAQGTAK